MARWSRRATTLPAGVSLLLFALVGPARGENLADLFAPGSQVTLGVVVEAPGAAKALEAVAAYYSKRYNGRRTTSGERYRPEKLTAAHQDLPLGSLVKVTHLESGREIVVKVNDRCRRRKEPFIDLSRAAAKELGFLGQGIARVRIELVPVEGLTAHPTEALAAEGVP